MLKKQGSAEVLDDETFANDRTVRYYGTGEDERGPNADFEVYFVFDETKVLEYQGGQVGNRYVFAHGL